MARRVVPRRGGRRTCPRAFSNSSRGRGRKGDLDVPLRIPSPATRLSGTSCLIILESCPAISQAVFLNGLHVPLGIQAPSAAIADRPRNAAPDVVQNGMPRDPEAPAHRAACQRVLLFYQSSLHKQVANLSPKKRPARKPGRADVCSPLACVASHRQRRVETQKPLPVWAGASLDALI